MKLICNVGEVGDLQISIELHFLRRTILQLQETHSISKIWMSCSCWYLPVHHQFYKTLKCSNDDTLYHPDRQEEESSGKTFYEMLGQNKIQVDN